MDLREAVSLARQLLVRHGLEGWTVVLDQAKTRAGVCRPQRRQIGLSRHLTGLHAESEVRDTILHEIAHALVGAAHGHDEVWRAKAVEIGCSGERCSSPDAPRLEGPWIGTCPAGHQQRRHRRPARVASCSRCCKAFSADHLFTWTYLGSPAAMHPNFASELAALHSDVPLPPAHALGPGARVRVTAPGRFLGVVGAIEKRGRTRFHVRVPQGVLAVPFALVEPE